MVNKINILLVDDHEIVRDGIKSILAKEPSFNITNETGHGMEAIEILKIQKNIDIVILDISLPDINGIELAKIIKTKYNKVKIIALTMHSEEMFALKMIKAGAEGYLLKGSGKLKLVKAIKDVVNGKKFYSTEVSNKVLSVFTDKNGQNLSLSEREEQILKHVIEGKSNKEIASILFLSPRTVEGHRRNLMHKLDVKNIAELITVAIKKGLYIP